MLAPEHSSTHDQEVQNALSAIGKALSTYSIYGSEHRIFDQTQESAYEGLCMFFSSHSALNIGAVSGRLVVDGQPVEKSNSLIKALERKVIALGITNLALRKGLTPDEFKKLIILLNQADQNKLKQAIDSNEISNIASEDELEYHLIRKGQEITDRPIDEPETASAGAGTEDDTSKNPKPEKDTPPPASSVNVDQIIAFMKGEPGSGGSAVESEIAKLASDPEKLGQMIMESVVIRQSIQSLDNTESMADVVLGCLRKTFDDLKGIDTFKKRNGKASMKKALVMLESSILDRIRKVTGEADPERDKKIIESVKNMRMDIDMEGVIEKYAEQTAALQRSQKKIVSYVEERGLADAKQIRRADEIPGEEWKKIAVDSTRKKHGISSGTGGNLEGLSGNMGTLAIVLEQLDQMMRKDDHRRNMDTLLEQADRIVSETTAQTEEKISILGKKISKEDAAKTTVEGTATKMTVAQLLGDISEITQELAQPLTAIGAVLEMILTGFVGTVSDEQRDLLQLATNSGDHLGYLMEQLKDIVGMPRMLGTDERFHHDRKLHAHE